MDSISFKEIIQDKLSKVIDPETGIDVLSMRLIKKLEIIENNGVILIFRPSMPTCPLGFRLAFDIRNAITQIKGIKEIDMKVIDFIHADKLNQILSEADNTK